jgi:hypothetical protein
MLINPAAPKAKNNCAGGGQQQFHNYKGAGEVAGTSYQATAGVGISTVWSLNSWQVVSEVNWIGWITGCNPCNG